MRDLMRRFSEGKLRGLFSGSRLREFFLGSRLRRLVLVASTLILLVGGLFVGVTLTHAAAYCKVNYVVTGQWPGSGGQPGGFNVQSISIQNTSSSAWSSWSLTWTFPDAGQKIPNGGWNGNFTQSGANVTVTNMGYNGSVATNASVNPAPGFNGTWTTSNPVPTNFAVNGNACNAAPPTVSLTSPANGASFTAPANIPLAATAQPPPPARRSRGWIS
jgi:cellulose 1,4-beta-cellobiosidase